MASPRSILGEVKGMARDFSMDTLPKGFVWDLADYIPSQRGAQLEGRAPWSFLTGTSLGAGQANTIWGGCDAVFSTPSSPTGTEKLLVHAGGNVWEQPRTANMQGSVNANQIGALFSSSLHNGRFYKNRVYWADAQGQNTPKAVSFDGTIFQITALSGANTPKPTLVDVYKNRLIAAGDPLNPNNIYWSGKGADLDPLHEWDVKGFIGFPRAVTALGPMANVCVVFHDGMTSRIKGGEHPPATGQTDKQVDTIIDTFSNQYGCVDPRSVVPWQENLIFANSHGVMLTDGSTIRSLSDQGGIGEVWRYLYALKRPETQVSCGIYLDKLFCSILTTWNDNTGREDRPFVFVCDLVSRAWYRLTNVRATCFIPSSTGAEQLWWGNDWVNEVTAYQNRLARISPMYLGLLDIDPDPEVPVSPTYAPAVDPNGAPILPRITTGWQHLGAEGQKRIRHIYVSHATQRQTTPTPPTGNVLRVGYRLTPVVLDNFVEVGQLPKGQNGLPFSTLYDRKRLPVGRAGYGIQVHVEQVLPSHISRLYDISVEAGILDRGRVS